MSFHPPARLPASRGKPARTWGIPSFPCPCVSFRIRLLSERRLPAAGTSAPRTRGIWLPFLFSRQKYLPSNPRTVYAPVQPFFRFVTRKQASPAFPPVRKFLRLPASLSAYARSRNASSNPKLR